MYNNMRTGIRHVFAYQYHRGMYANATLPHGKWRNATNGRRRKSSLGGPRHNSIMSWTTKTQHCSIIFYPIHSFAFSDSLFQRSQQCRNLCVSDLDKNCDLFLWLSLRQHHHFSLSSTNAKWCTSCDFHILPPLQRVSLWIPHNYFCRATDWIANTWRLHILFACSFSGCSMWPSIYQ